MAPHSLDRFTNLSLVDTIKTIFETFQATDATGEEFKAYFWDVRWVAIIRVLSRQSLEKKILFIVLYIGQAKQDRTLHQSVRDFSDWFDTNLGKTDYGNQRKHYRRMMDEVWSEEHKVNLSSPLSQDLIRLREPANLPDDKN